MLTRKAEKYINEWIRNPKRALLVSGARQVDLKINISALSDVSFVDNETILFIDEVQEYRYCHKNQVLGG